MHQETVQSDLKNVSLEKKGMPKKERKYQNNMKFGTIKYQKRFNSGIMKSKNIAIKMTRGTDDSE